MGGWSDVGDILNAPTEFLREDLMGGKAARDAANAKVEAAQNAGELQREFSEVLQKDAEPLRNLRNDRLLDLRDLFAGPSNFKNSSDFKVVRDAAASTVKPGQRGENALLMRAEQIGNAQFNPYRNRVSTEAGISSKGLNSTNRLLQANTNAQVDILNRAAAAAGQGLIDHSQSNAQTVSGLASLFGGGF